MPSFSLTQRDHKILDCLANRVRLLTTDQLSRAFFDGDDRYAKRRSNVLLKAGLLKVSSLVARISPPLDHPLYCWRPGMETPNYNHFSVLLRRRWGRQPSREASIFILGKNANNLVGGRYLGRIKNALQIGHDLALSEVFLHYLRVEPELTRSWFVEDRINKSTLPSKRGIAIPDAMLVDRSGKPIRAIELGGVYSVKRLRTLHQTFSNWGLSYELW